MIIRFTAEEKEEIDRTIKPLEQEAQTLLNQLLNLPEDNFTVTDGVAKPCSKEAIELAKKEGKCRKKLIDATAALYVSFEDRRFKKIESKPYEIMRNAIAQTDAILANIATALHLNNTNLKPEEFVLYHKDTEALRRVWTAELYKCIVRAKGDIEQLDAQIVIAFIKRELHRHYEKLDTSDANKLTKYIEQTVTKAIPQPKKLPSGYFKAFFDKRIDTIAQLNSRYVEPFEVGNIEILGIQVGKDLYYFENIDEAVMKLGVETHKLLLVALREFTQNTKENTVRFSSEDYFRETRPNTYNPSLKRQYKKKTREYLDTLQTISIPYKYKKRKATGKGYTTVLGRLVLFPRAEIDDEAVIIRFVNELTNDLRRNKNIAQYPYSLLAIDARDPNTYRIALKLSSRYSNYDNILNQRHNVIGVQTLWDATDLPRFDQADSHYKRDIIDALEASLNKLRDKYHVLKSWNYIKPKRGEETPQERGLSKREVEEIRNDLIKWSKHYVTYEMEDKLDLTEKAIDFNRRREEAILEQKEKLAIKAAKALEKIEEKTNGKG